MRTLSILAAVAMMAAGTSVFAQQDKQPGGNVPLAQGPCAAGYKAAVKEGRMNLSQEQMKRVDTNSDGRISEAEFNAACSNRLFTEQDNKG